MTTTSPTLAQTSRTLAQKLLIDASPVIHGRRGWVIENGSNTPISGLEVRTSDHAAVTVYRTNGTVEGSNPYREAVLGPRESTTSAFRPSPVLPHPVPSEIEKIMFTFSDARDVRWKRVGTARPTPVEE
jgi:hypothetical protein